MDGVDGPHAWDLSPRIQYNALRSSSGKDRIWAACATPARTWSPEGVVLSGRGLEMSMTICYKRIAYIYL